MKALLVIDVQNGIVETSDFKQELSTIDTLIQEFKQADLPVIFMKHVVDQPENPLYRASKGAELHASISAHADVVIEKQTPSSFYQTNLATVLEEANVDHLFITGFNAEFCPQFTAIAAFDRGYQVTYIEDAVGTVNTDDTYEMPGLDVKEFVSTALHWSNVIEVLDYEEYQEVYGALV